MRRFFLLLVWSLCGCCFEYSEKAGEIERNLKISEETSKSGFGCVPVTGDLPNAELLLWRC